MQRALQQEGWQVGGAGFPWRASSPGRAVTLHSFPAPCAAKPRQGSAESHGAVSAAGCPAPLQGGHSTGRYLCLLRGPHGSCSLCWGRQGWPGAAPHTPWQHWQCLAVSSCCCLGGLEQWDGNKPSFAHPAVPRQCPHSMVRMAALLIWGWAGDRLGTKRMH